MRAIYVSASNDQARANALGLGLIVVAGTATPFAFLQGAGLSFTMPEPINIAAMQANQTTIIAAEATNDAAAATTTANLQTLLTRAANAIAANVSYLGIATPTNAQVLAQVNALTLQVDALIRVVANQLSSTSGT